MRRSPFPSVLIAMLALLTLYLVRRPATAAAQYTVNIPKAYGLPRFMAGESFVFEASDGTLRFVEPRTGRVIQIITRN
jgi:hypothetical protein